MKEVIYLVVSQNKVERMTKRLPDLYRGEIPVKLTLNVPKEAFNPPTLDQEVYVEDWRQGIDLEDVEFRQSIITKEEAEVIRQTRLEKMKTVLEAQEEE
jgi:hypothetical protein